VIDPVPTGIVLDPWFNGSESQRKLKRNLKTGTELSNLWILPIAGSVKVAQHAIVPYFYDYGSVCTFFYDSGSAIWRSVKRLFLSS